MIAQSPSREAQKVAENTVKINSQGEQDGKKSKDISSSPSKAKIALFIDSDDHDIRGIIRVDRKLPTRTLPVRVSISEKNLLQHLVSVLNLADMAAVVRYLGVEKYNEIFFTNKLARKKAIEKAEQYKRKTNKRFNARENFYIRLTDPEKLVFSKMAEILKLRGVGTVIKFLIYDQCESYLSNQ